MTTSSHVSNERTVEEFARALERHVSGEPIRICMLFKTAPLEMTSIDPEQIGKVQRFKKRVSDAGGFYKEFSTDDQLRFHLQAILSQVANSYSRAMVGSELQPISKTGGSHNITDAKNIVGVEIISTLDDIGLFEIESELERVVSSLTIDLQPIAESTSTLGEMASWATEKLNEAAIIGHVKPADIKPVIDKVAECFENSAQVLEEKLPAIEKDLTEFSFLIAKAVELSAEFGVDHNQLAKLSDEVSTAVAVIVTATSNQSEFVATVVGLPRLSQRFNQARSRWVAPSSTLIKLLTNSRDEIQKALATLKNMVEPVEKPQIQ